MLDDGLDVAVEGGPRDQAEEGMAGVDCSAGVEFLPAVLIDINVWTVLITGGETENKGRVVEVYFYCEKSAQAAYMASKYPPENVRGTGRALQ